MKPEIFTPANAATVEKWASSVHPGPLSFWAGRPDTETPSYGGSCPNDARDTWSGVVQTPWEFTMIFKPEAVASQCAPASRVGAAAQTVG